VNDHVLDRNRLISQLVRHRGIPPRRPYPAINSGVTRFLLGPAAGSGAAGSGARAKTALGRAGPSPLGAAGPSPLGDSDRPRAIVEVGGFRRPRSMETAARHPPSGRSRYNHSLTCRGIAQPALARRPGGPVA
jgi:hypothetical protein